ncbi:hypothetical protein P7K49_013473 [Saguinus oedipus]|uniref:Prothymosin alpha n=1 Tax=Saguinus oedipus TaxID=9490 RepID=A0ABQ9VI48_SAGOE|nr:hypothetical protein P7K49_013473 [Saguinus oedipus]
MKDLKEKKEVVEEAENGRDAPANGNAENEENGEQEADNEVDEEEEEGGEEEEEEEEGDDLGLPDMELCPYPLTLTPESVFRAALKATDLLARLLGSSCLDLCLLEMPTCAVGEEEDGDEDEEAESATGKRAAEDDEDDDVDTKKQKTDEDD